MAARGLGKGLDSLIPSNITIANEQKKKTSETSTQAEQPSTLLKISEIEPNREQPRKSFDEDKLIELADSIKQVGLIEPIVVKKMDDYYMIVAGERRWRAAKIAGIKEIPVVIKDFSEQQIAMIALIENLQREDLNPIEEAQAYKQLMTKFEMTQDQVAEKVGKSRSAVTNSLRLLKLAPGVQQMVIEGILTYGHARALIPVEDEAEQQKLAERIVKEELNVRDVEKLIKSLGKNHEKKPKAEPDAQMKAVYASIEDKLKNALGMKVAISPKENGSGKLEIEFYSNDDLERIIEKLS